MKKVRIVFQIVFIAVLSACSDKEMKKAPNILFIFTDDQSYRSVSAYQDAYEWVNTPNIDKLADEGMKFANFFSGTWCMASRATLLTGLHSYGIQSLRMSGPYPQNEYDPDTLKFWPSVFREKGYYTGLIGKWHTGSDDGYGRDWDYTAVWNHAAGGNGSYYHDQKISFNGAKSVAVGGYSTDNYTQYAIDFIQKRSENQTQPWYLWLCFDAPHGPYTPAERHENEYREVPQVPIPVDIFPPRPGKPSHMVNYDLTWMPDEDGYPVHKSRKVNDRPMGFDELIQTYNRPILSLDEGVGKLIQALSNTNQLENTIVVYTSDQGFAIGEHGFEFKYAPYEANLKAPMIIQWPGVIPKGSVCKHPLGGHDLIPTFFKIAGIDLPWEMHGHDMSRLLKKPEDSWENPLMLVNTFRLYGDDTNVEYFPINKEIPCWISLRKGDIKYVRYLIENELEELYDVSADPEELTNLATEKSYKDNLLEMRLEMINELQRTHAPFIDKIPKPLSPWN
ncbi:MAG: sulfatase-like hydrolase/transferase [Cyclobacteriaceae bacterium]|nr:sulfatase-like hydrolase/transferase [Cyclobacteriaceae bacterium]